MSDCNVTLKTQCQRNATQRLDHYKGLLFYLFCGQLCGRATKRIQLAAIKCNVQLKMKLSKGKTGLVIQLNVSIRMKLTNQKAHYKRIPDGKE